MIFCLIFVGWEYKLSVVGVQGSTPIHSEKNKKSLDFGQAQGPVPTIGFSLLGWGTDH